MPPRDATNESRAPEPTSSLLPHKRIAQRGQQGQAHGAQAAVGAAAGTAGNPSGLRANSCCPLSPAIVLPAQTRVFRACCCARADLQISQCGPCTATYKAVSRLRRLLIPTQASHRTRAVLPANHNRRQRGDHTRIGSAPWENELSGSATLDDIVRRSGQL